MAALCAEPQDREAVAAGIEQAIELERALISGHGARAAAVEPPADALAAYLRAILRDVVCGHLDADLRRVADELLAAEEVPVHGDQPVDVMDVALQMGDEDGLIVAEL